MRIFQGFLLVLLLIFLFFMSMHCDVWNESLIRESTLKLRRWLLSQKLSLNSFYSSDSFFFPICWHLMKPAAMAPSLIVVIIIFSFLFCIVTSDAEKWHGDLNEITEPFIIGMWLFTPSQFEFQDIRGFDRRILTWNVHPSNDKILIKIDKTRKRLVTIKRKSLDFWVI